MFTAYDAVEATQLAIDAFGQDWCFVACFGSGVDDGAVVGSWQTYPDEPITLRRNEVLRANVGFTVVGFEEPAGEANVAAVDARHWTLAVKQVVRYFHKHNRPYKFAVCLSGLHKPILQYQQLVAAVEPSLYVAETTAARAVVNKRVAHDDERKSGPGIQHGVRAT